MEGMEPTCINDETHLIVISDRQDKCTRVKP